MSSSKLTEELQRFSRLYQSLLEHLPEYSLSLTLLSTGELLSLKAVFLMK
ncbi:hypothetical protein QUF81_19590 [Peribacillus simplex]|nr:hypothetical protein [Peribacillus simplex]MDM5295319.1 hypothetical protein [Peribacillus simplex]